MTDENSRAVTATIVGAMVGAAMGYFFFTENGRSLRRQLEPALDDISRELNSFRSTVQKAAGVATEGWQVLNDALGETAGAPPPRHTGTHQTSPF